VAPVRCVAGAPLPCVRVRLRLPAADLAGGDEPESVRPWRARLGPYPLEPVRARVLRDVGPPRAVLTLVDASGSMRDNGGAQVARAAVRSFVRDLGTGGGAVRAAVAAFSSRGVAAGVRAAAFTSPDTAAGAVDRLPAPAGNTGLYAAVIAGAERVAAEAARLGGGAQAALVVVTDGRNDVVDAAGRVRPGDDAGLATGADGRRAAAETARRLGVVLFLVGVGAEPDMTELGALAADRGLAFRTAVDAVALREALARVDLALTPGRELVFAAVGGGALVARPPGVAAARGARRGGGRAAAAVGGPVAGARARGPGLRGCRVRRPVGRERGAGAGVAAGGRRRGGGAGGGADSWRCSWRPWSGRRGGCRARSGGRVRRWPPVLPRRGPRRHGRRRAPLPRRARRGRCCAPCPSGRPRRPPWERPPSPPRPLPARSGRRCARRRRGVPATSRTRRRAGAPRPAARPLRCPGGMPLRRRDARRSFPRPSQAPARILHPSFPPMPVVRVTRAGVRPAPREVPTDTTLTVLPMTFDRVGQEAGEDEAPTRISTLQEAFEQFAPSLDFRTTAGEEGTEFVAELEFKSLKTSTRSRSARGSRASATTSPTCRRASTCCIACASASRRCR
jgi:hypothetical protein